MSKSKRTSDIRKLMSAVFEIPENALPAECTQHSIAEWDSLNHLKLVVALESHFGVRFSMTTIPQLTSLDRICKELEHVQP